MFMCARPADHTIDDQSVCQTICDWNTSCAAYEWGDGCYLSSEWGFEAMGGLVRPPGALLVRLVRFLMAAPLPPMQPPSAQCTARPNKSHSYSSVPQMSSGQRASSACYLKSIPPAMDAKSCAGAATHGGCDDHVVSLSASLAIAHAKKIVMTGNHDIGRWMRIDDQLTSRDKIHTVPRL